MLLRAFTKHCYDHYSQNCWKVEAQLSLLGRRGTSNIWQIQRTTLVTVTKTHKNLQKNKIFGNIEAKKLKLNIEIFSKKKKKKKEDETHLTMVAEAKKGVYLHILLF